MTFAAPLFLIAALAGLIPLALHMINRQKAPVLPFSTLRFLRLSVQRTRRRKYLHDVLLMLLRVAALVLIAVGLAKPTLTRLGSLLAGRAASAVVLILDNSASMACVDEGGSRWEVARRACEVVLEQLQEGDSVALLATCGPPRPELERLYSNQEVVRQALDACALSYERADLALRLKAARQLLDRADAPNKEIYLVTDMQAVSWSSLGEVSAEAPRAGRTIPLVLVDVHRGLLPNVALRRLSLQAAGPVAGVPVRLTVELSGDTAAVQKRHLQLSLDGRPLEISPTLTLPPGGKQEHVFQFTLAEPGMHRGEVQLLGNDACPRDDRLYFAITLDPQVPVAIVHPRDHEIPYLDDAFYLERALVPVADGSWPVRVTKLLPAGLAAETLPHYAAVFCVNLPPLEPPAVEQLGDYVRGGGHLVWICGPNVDPVLYSRMQESAHRELLPVRLAALREPSPDRPDGWHVGWVDRQHQVLAPFAEPVSTYQSVLVYRHVQMAPAEESGARVLARLDDGQPLLVERKIGSGSSVLLGTSVHVDWSNLPLRPLFLPLFARLTYYLAGAEAAASQLVAGTPLQIPLAGAAPHTVEVVNPAGETTRQDVEDSQGQPFRFADTHEAGVYAVCVSSPNRRRQMAFAMNMDPQEPSPEIMPAESLRQRLENTSLVFCSDLAELAATMRRLREGEGLLDLFLLAVLVALVAEAFVANRRVTERPSEALRSAGATGRRPEARQPGPPRASGGRRTVWQPAPGTKP